MKINELFEEIKNDTPNQEISVDFTAVIGGCDKAAIKLLDAIYKSLPDNSTFGDADKIIDDMKWWNAIFNMLAKKHENL